MCDIFISTGYLQPEIFEKARNKSVVQALFMKFATRIRSLMVGHITSHFQVVSAS